MQRKKQLLPLIGKPLVQRHTSIQILAIRSKRYVAVVSFNACTMKHISLAELCKILSARIERLDKQRNQQLELLKGNARHRTAKARIALRECFRLD